jgi:hypothetical protein
MSEAVEWVERSDVVMDGVWTNDLVATSTLLVKS